MPGPFAITTVTNTVNLDANRRGEASFTVSNTRKVPIRGHVRLEAEASTSTAWLTLEGAEERNFAIDDTEQYTVKIAVPADTPAGTYSFHLDAVGVENPDELYTQGPSVTFQVPEPEPKKPFPWWIVIVAIGGLALCCALGVVGYLIINPPGPSPTPTDTADLMEDFVGVWVNADSNTGGMTRLEIQKVDDETVSLHGFGKCHPTDCDWGEITVPFTPPVLEGTWDFGFKTSTITVEKTGDRLAVEIFDDYAEGDSRPDRTVNYQMVRE